MNDEDIIIPLVIVGGLAALYFAVKHAESVTTPPSSGIVIAGSPAPVNFAAGVAEETSSDTEITSLLGIGTSSVNATSTISNSQSQSSGGDQSLLGLASSIAGPILGVITSIAGLFTKGHTQAVEVEATTLNGAMPAFLQSVEQTMYDLNEGIISPSTAIAELNAAQTAYYAAVASIIKKSGPCTNPCTITATGAEPRCCTTQSTCNAACCNGCVVVEQSVINFTRIINAGGGTYSISGTPDNGAIQGTPGVTITYTPYVAPPEYDVVLTKIGSWF